MDDSKFYFQQGKLFGGSDATVTEQVIAASAKAAERYIDTGSTKGCYLERVTVLSDGTKMDWFDGAPREVIFDGVVVRDADSIISRSDWENRRTETISGRTFVSAGMDTEFYARWARELGMPITHD